MGKPIKTAEDILALHIGQLVMRLAALTAENEQLRERLEELEAPEKES